MNEIVKNEKAGIRVCSTLEMTGDVPGETYRYDLSRRSMLSDFATCQLSRKPLSLDNIPVHLRLISHRDMSSWTDFVNSCSERSLWLRFLSPFTPTPEKARRFCDVNPAEEIAVVAETNRGDQRGFLGIARLIRNRRCEDEIEYALLVSDPWQQKKLGYLLSGRCIELAKEAGFKTIRFETLQENFPIIRIFKQYNFQFDSKDENMISMSLNFT